MTISQPPPSPRATSPASADDLLQSLPTGIFAIDAEDRFTYANPSAEAMLALSVGQLRQMTLEDVFGSGSAVTALIRHARERFIPMAEFDIHVSTPRAELDRVSISTAPVFQEGAPSENGNMVVQFAPFNIAQRIDQQMHRQGAARSVAGLVAVLAHEVRNPLAGIRGAAQIIEAAVDGDEKVLSRLIADEVDRIGNLIQRIDVFAEIGPAPDQPVNVHEAIERARRVLESSGALDGLEVIEVYDPSLPAVRGEFEGLVQVFINLLKNAADAAREGGQKVTLRSAYRHNFRLAAERRPEAGILPIEVSIEDNGPGIPDDLKGSLFDPFVTTKSNGHGLGLAVVAKIAGDHGGAVEFDSEPRRTVFTVQLPQYAAPEKPS